MKPLITKTIQDQFKKTGSQDLISYEEKLIIAKYFNPINDALWYIADFDPKGEMFFGYCSLYSHGVAEWGYISLSELIDHNVERDLYFVPCQFKEIKGVKHNG